MRGRCGQSCERHAGGNNKLGGHRKGPAVKWSNVIVLLLEEHDEKVLFLAQDYTDRYTKSDDIRCFSADGEVFPALTRDCLRDICTLETKVLVFAHGDQYTVDGMDPTDLTAYLKKLGIHKVGLLAFKACEVGKGHFLIDLRRRLDMAGVQVGWLIGYTGVAYQVAGNTFLANGMVDLALRTASCGRWKMPDFWRVHVVQGNVRVTPPGGASSRYEG